MNKKVDYEFKGINDVYFLQCLCTEYKYRINKAIKKIRENCIDDEYYLNLSNKEKAIFDVLFILENGVDIND